MTDLRAQLLAEVCGRLEECSHDELRVFDVLSKRVLRLGRRTYPPLDLSRDARDWTAEAAAELADMLFYLGCREVAANDRRLERQRCEAADISRERVEIGLAELRDAEVTEPRKRPSVADFDFSEGG